MKSLHRLLALVGCLPCAPAVAEATPAPAPVAAATPSPQAERLRAADLRQQGDAARLQAEARYKIDQDECARTFLMSACLDAAKQARNAALVEARKPVAEAREIERRLRQEEVDQREARRLADAPRREQEALEQAARNRAEQEAAMERVERRQAEKARRTRDQ